MHNHHSENWQPHASSKNTVSGARWGLGVPEQGDGLLEKRSPSPGRLRSRGEGTAMGPKGSES